MTRTVIVGAGVAGLATAALLARQGHDVEVFERGDAIGGRAGSVERDGFRFDAGPSWYLMPRVFEHFFELLGTSSAEQLDLRLLDPAYSVFSEPRPDGSPTPPLTVPYGQERVEEAFESREPGARAALRAYLDSAGRAAKMAERYFLYNPYTRPGPLLRRDVLRALPELAGLLTTSLASFVARRFRDPVLRQVLGYPAVFLGASPASAPAIYHLMSALDLAEGVQYPMGGFWELVQRIAALAEAEGARITTGADVTAITTSPGAGRRRRVTGVDWRSADGTVRHAAADAIFGDAPRVPDPASIYVCKPSQTDPTVAPEGHENLFVLVPVPADPALGRGGPDGSGAPAIERAADAAIAQIARWAGIPDLEDRVVVRQSVGPADFAERYNSWSGGMLGPAHILRQSAMFRPQNQSRRVAGLYYAGATTAPGVGVPMCLISAELVSKRINSDHSSGPTSPQPRNTR